MYRSRRALDCRKVDSENQHRGLRYRSFTKENMLHVLNASAVDMNVTMDLVMRFGPLRVREVWKHVSLLACS